MGQCGCADFIGEFTLPAPDGGLYVFWRYAPCNDCKTPAGLVVCHLDAKDIKDWDADKLPRLAIDSERLIPVVSAESLAAVFAGVLIEDLYDDGEGYKTLEDYLSDVGYEQLGEAMSSSDVGEWGDWKPEGAK